MNSKPDLLVVWPDTIDFPMFRQWVKEERERFNKVIVVFSKTNWPFTNLIEWVHQAMKHDNIHFVTSLPVESGADWRNIAVKTGLLASESDWLFFTEPDFFPNKNLWEELKLLPKRAEVVGATQDRRLHPCCLFIKRTLLDKTSKDFSAHPPEHDHFGQIQKDLARIPHYFYAINPKFYYHMNGLSHNMFLIQSGKMANYKPEELKSYLKDCLKLQVPLHPEFIQLVEDYENSD